MSFIDNGKAIEVLMSNNYILKIRSNDKKGEIIIVQCNKDKLVVNKSNEDDNIAMSISLSNELIGR